MQTHVAKDFFKCNLDKILYKTHIQYMLNVSFTGSEIGKILIIKDLKRFLIIIL